MTTPGPADAATMPRVRPPRSSPSHPHPSCCAWHRCDHQAVVLCAGADHTMLLVNAAAAASVPTLTDGGTALEAPFAALVEAVVTGAESVTGEYAGRRLRGRRRRLDADHYSWYLRDWFRSRPASAAGRLPQQASSPR